MKCLKKHRSNKIVYKLLNINDNTKDKECVDADRDNEKLYRKTINKIKTATKNWENTGVSLTLEIPEPPKPNNYDRLLLFRKENVLRPAIQQSQATLYLFKNNYILGKDYEAYQAIDLFNKLKIFESQNTENINDLIKKDINLDILKTSPKLERKRHSLYNNNLGKKNEINLENRERSKSLGEKKYLKNTNSNTNINDKIFSFQMMSKLNKNKSEDFIPGIIASAPPIENKDNDNDNDNFDI